MEYITTFLPIHFGISSVPCDLSHVGLTAKKCLESAISADFLLNTTREVPDLLSEALKPFVLQEYTFST